MNRNDYRKIAKRHGISTKVVKQEMQKAIDAAYESPNFHARCVLRMEEKPTAEELIAHCVRRIKLQ